MGATSLANVPVFTVSAALAALEHSSSAPLASMLFVSIWNLAIFTLLLPWSRRHNRRRDCIPACRGCQRRRARRVATDSHRFTQIQVGCFIGVHCVHRWLIYSLAGCIATLFMA